MLTIDPKTALLVSACLASSALAPLEKGQGMSERDQKELAKHLQEYLDPEAPEEDKLEAKEDFREALAKIGKRLAEDGEDPVQAALSDLAGLGGAMRLATPLKSKKSGTVLEGETELQGNPIRYRVWTPDAYKHTGDPLPLLLCLPGLGDSGPMSPEQFLSEQWMQTKARDGALIAAVELPAEVESWSAATDSAGGPGGVACAMVALGDLRREFAIDPDRVYLVGRGAAVPAAVAIGGMFPHLFAGVVGQAGDAGSAGWANYQNLPTFFQGGGAEATAFYEGTKEFGNCELRPEASCDEIWAWMQEHPRIANPAKVTLVPGSPIPNKAYWVEIPPIAAEGDMSITAEADRTANSISVTSKGIDTVTLYLNDEIVDLDRPIELVLNGAKQEALVPRSVDDFLTLTAKGTNDSKRLYVARGTYDLP
jgi:poly(3-hydroxybutyrate) depolymerase